MTPVLFALLVTGAHGRTIPAPPPLAADPTRVDPFSERTTLTPTATATTGFRGSLAAVHVRDPLVFRPASGADPIAIVGPVWGLHAALAGSRGPTALAVSLPVYASVDSDLPPDDAPPGSALGDVALDARVVGLDAGAARGLGLAGQARVTAPLGGDAAYLGQPGFTWEVLVVGELRRASTAVVAAIGTRGVPEVSLDGGDLSDPLVVRASVQQALGTGGVSVELLGHRPYRDFFDDPAHSPLEVLVGGWHAPTPDRRVRGAVGVGVNPGIGSPLLRLVVGVGADAARTGADAARSAD